MDREWTAKWIGPETGDTFQPVLFKDFYIDDRIKGATLYIASTGLFEAYINGRRVGNEYLLPYPGRTKSEIPYFVYDVTDYLNSGRESDVNSVDVFLGPGWESDDLPYALKAEFEVEVYKESGEENDLAETDGSETYISETDGPETYGSEIDDLEAYISETDGPEMYGSGTDDMGVDDPETDDLMDVGFLDELDFEKEDTLSDQPSASGKIFLLARKGAHRSKPVKSPFALGDLDELDDFLAGVIDPTAAEEDDGEGEPNAPSVYRRSVTREKRRKPMFYTLEESETAETENAEISSEEKKNEADETTKDSLKEPEVFPGIIGEKTKALPESFEEESEEQPVSFEEEPEEQPESFEEEPEEQPESFEGEPEELPESFEDEPEIQSEIIVEEPDATEENAEPETAAEDDLEIFDFEDWDENTGTAVQTEEADETEDVTRKPDITLHVSPYQITEEQIEGLFDDGKKGAEAEEEISGAEADEFSDDELTFEDADAKEEISGAEADELSEDELTFEDADAEEEISASEADELLEEELTFEDEDADEEISASEADELSEEELTIEDKDEDAEAEDEINASEAEDEINASEAEEIAAGNERIEAKKAEIEAMIANFEFGSDSEENPEELEALLDELQIETELESSTVTEDVRLPEEMSRAAAETEPASEAEHEMEWAASEELEGSTVEELSELEALLDEIDLESEISEAEEPAAEETFERSAIPEEAEAESETETEPAAEEAFERSAMPEEAEAESETETEPAAKEAFVQSAMSDETETEVEAAEEEPVQETETETAAEETFERSAIPEEAETETEPEAAAPGWTAPALAAGAALPAAAAFGLAAGAAAEVPETETEPAAEETFEPEAMPEEMEAETVPETAETDTEPEAPEAETEPAAEEIYEPEAEAPEVDEYVPGGEEYIPEEEEWDPEEDADAFVQDFFGDEDAGFRTETDTILIVTDETWKYYASDIESSRPDSYEVFNRMLWDGARNPEKDVVVQEREIPLKKADHLPVVIKEELSVQEILYSPEGKPVLDFGRCFAGFLTFRSTLPRGTRVRFTFAEQQEGGRLLSADSSEGFYYVSDGVPEVVSSHFTSFLGRYVEIDGWTGELKPEDFTAMVLYADMERTGYAETSSEVLNRKFDDFLWNQKKESLMIPKDGTPEDVLAFSSGANYNMDTKDFLSAYLKELDAETLGDKGAFAAGLIWNLYQMSGDEELLSEHYELLTSWVRRLDDLDAEREEKEYLYDPDPAEDIWLSMDDETETAFLASAYYYDAAVIAGEAAAVLGKEQESYRFRRLAGRIKQAFLEEFFTASGRLAVDTQSAYILSLHLGLYIDKEKVKKALAARLEKDGKRMKCGSAAAPYFCRTLAENGMADVAYDVLLDPEPGRFANEIGFLYYSVAGIRPLEPGFSAVKLMPIPSGKLRSCSCSYQSAYGDIVSNWQIGDNGSLAFHFEIPEGITAKIALPYYPVCAAGGNEVTVKHGKYDYAYMPSVTL